MKATVSANVTRVVARRSGRTRAGDVAFAAWVGGFSLVLAVLFAGVTLVTVGMWLADPAYSETNPVVDVGFFVLGAVLVGAGLLAQLRAPERHIAGLQQALVGLLSLAAAGYIGRRIEPFWGALILILATAIAIYLHPARRQIVRRGAGLSVPLAALALAAIVPAIVYADRMLALARQAGPSCFMGQCARGDRFAEVAALAIALVLVAALASARTAGWTIAAWSAGVGATIFGLASISLPAVSGSPGQSWGIATVVWGLLVVAAATWQARRSHPARHSKGGLQP